MTFHSSSLPDFPWDTLVPIRERAATYINGVVDLTIGTPVDPTPKKALEALAEAADGHGYPPTQGTAELREAIFGWMGRRRNVTAPTDIILSLGSKETVALLPSLLGLGSSDIVAFPKAAYPTYDVGARLAGATPLAIDTAADPASWSTDISLLWLNSPGNPDGHVLEGEQLRRIVHWARENDVVVASDECYAELCWEAESPSLLNAEVCGDDASNLLMLYSLSKQSNMAGYRAAFMAGDPRLIADMMELRKHMGFMLPSPVQHAMAVMLSDDEHVAAQREIYRRRRQTLLEAVESAGLENDPLSVAGLYLWVSDPSRRADAWDITRAMAELGIVVAPGTFYGDGGTRHVRMSLTAHDDDIAQAAERLPRIAEVLAGLSATPAPKA